ncbi:hypothetical protein NPIL_458141 [Nephila pilipes]|uniref:Uncharacterized protein n=1 Tax=Nephila pilipes TaxID=299642 RepID=A0A8X6NAK2_NEPPI|nr:hypothetical protein NPIL_458141 [Nephila pilipes]
MFTANLTEEDYRARLELCSAVLLLKLMQRIQAALRVGVSKTYYKNDCMIMLSWIEKQPSQLKTFMVNRVATILDLSCDEQRSHVSSVLQSG